MFYLCAALFYPSLHFRQRVKKLMRDPRTCSTVCLSSLPVGQPISDNSARYYMKHCLPSRPHFVSLDLPNRHTNAPMRQIISVRAGTLTVRGTGLHHMHHLAIALWMCSKQHNCSLINGTAPPWRHPVHV